MSMHKISDERLAECLTALSAERVDDAHALNFGWHELRSILTELQSLRSSDSVSDGSKGVRVKPLEWHGPDVNGDIHARSILAVYTVRKQQGSMGFWLTEVGGYHRTVEAAKAAAQADYRQRILSALDSGTGGQQPVAWSSIEAAPKDGTVILGITMEAQLPAWRITWWDGEGWVRVWKPEKFVMPGPARWWPTHWVNLPPTSHTEPKAGVVSEDMVERATAAWQEAHYTGFVSDAAGAMRTALTAALNGDKP